MPASPTTEKLFRPSLKINHKMDTILNFIQSNLSQFYIVILSVFLGIEVISRVPSVLHTPLMSGANAIHGVIIIGSIIVMGQAATDNYLALILGFLAVIVGTINVVGGFVVTDRMLEMFKTGKEDPSKKTNGK
jgi:NAD(P) transhydrogenase subunit alpha